MSEQDTTLEHGEHAGAAGTAEPPNGAGHVSDAAPAQEQESPVGLGLDAGAAEGASERSGDAGVEGLAGDAAEEPAGSDTSGRSGRSDREVERLEQEGEVAADFLERLLDIADLDGDIDVDVDGDRASVAIVDSDEGRVPRRLVGPDGRVLEALQELTRLAVQASTGNRSRLMLDVAGHRASRRADLVELARTAIERVRSTGEPEELEPMTAFERKVVHDEVLASGLVSESEGDEPDRYVVVLPADTADEDGADAGSQGRAEGGHEGGAENDSQDDPDSGQQA